LCKIGHDPEFVKDPSLMYTQDHIEAVYNPEVATGNGLTIFLGIVIVCVLLVAAWFVLFRIRWGN